MKNKNHWDNVYETKQSNEVSWTQEKPKTSLQLIANCNLPKTAKIIDIGGGDSTLVDCLLTLGYIDVTVLDISEKAIEKAKTRLGKLAETVKWIVSDITEFQPTEKYEVWHDRATFHFLKEEMQIEKYQTLVQDYVSDYLIMATFSDKGPLKCSGLEIKQYSIVVLEHTFQHGFQKVESFCEDHQTPFGTTQNFTFCRFEKKK